MCMTGTAIHMGTAMAVIRIGTTDGIVLIGRIDPMSGPNRLTPAFNLRIGPDHRLVWVVPPECREAVVAKFWLDINLAYSRFVRTIITILTLVLN
jgi:hypothetical protein